MSHHMMEMSSQTAENARKTVPFRESRTMSGEMQEMLNQQIEAELNSAYIYQGMSIYCAEEGFSGFAHWFRQQSQEEREHADRIITYLSDRGAPITLPNLKGPRMEYGSLMQVFETAYEHEKTLSVNIHQLYAVAQSLGEFDTQAFLSWFLTEQVEEEALFAGLIQKLKMYEGMPKGYLLELDKELASR